MTAFKIFARMPPRRTNPMCGNSQPAMIAPANADRDVADESEAVALDD